jgi:hypothetical protein
VVCSIKQDSALSISIKFKETCYPTIATSRRVQLDTVNLIRLSHAVVSFGYLFYVFPVIACAWSDITTSENASRIFSAEDHLLLVSEAGC